MLDGENQPVEANRSARDTVLLVGQAPLPGSLRSFSASGPLSVEIEVDRRAGTVTQILCSDLPPSASALLEELFLAQELESCWDSGTAALEERYFAANRVALLQAIQAARRQFEHWKRAAGVPRLQALPTETGSDPMVSAEGPSPNNHAGRRGSKRQLATLLVTLLAHSQLLDGYDGDHRAGRPIPSEARRQAVQLYVVLQQILHSVQAEQGLLEPQIEPLAIPALLQRALGRCTALGRQVRLEQRLPADLAPARGDPLVLEEALFLLLDEVAAYALSAGAAVEITAERRRTELQLTIALRSRESGVPAGPDDEDGASTLTDPLEQMWEGGLGTLAARTLVEHQGGRLWMQDGFPQDHHILCLALPAHGAQEEADHVASDRRNDPPVAARKTARVTAAWR